jgi:hypothetical protein
MNNTPDDLRLVLIDSKINRFWRSAPLRGILREPLSHLRRANLFLMLGGHLDTAGKRQETGDNSNTVYFLRWYPDPSVMTATFG